MQVMDGLVKRNYHHGNLANALLVAVKTLLDQDRIQEVGLRELARHVGVSATAAYRHFASKEHLLATVAAVGFKDLSATLDAASSRGEPVGRAYIEFALHNRGLFRLMFGPILNERANYPALDQAAEGAFSRLRSLGAADGSPPKGEIGDLAAWGLIHGLSGLFLAGVLPEERVGLLANEIKILTRPSLRGLGSVNRRTLVA